MKVLLERAEDRLEQLETGFARVLCREKFWLDAPFQPEANYQGHKHLWYEARLNYSFNDHVKFGVAYYGNDLSSGADCVTQAWTDCDDSVFATLTLSGNLSDLSK